MKSRKTAKKKPTSLIFWLLESKNILEKQRMLQAHRFGDKRVFGTCNNIDKKKKKASEIYTVSGT